MSTGLDSVPREVLERRLLDRHVNCAGDAARAAFLGTDGRADWKTAAASRVLGMWPRIKAVPVLGPAVHRLFAWLRKRGA